MNHTITLPSTWHDKLSQELDKPYFIDLMRFLDSEERQGKPICPIRSNWFKAYELTPFDEVKVVIVGQDPYHTKGMAHGIAFSVPDGVKIPPSLQNIFRELQNDIKFDIPTSGNLTYWAKNGVFLINAILTVEQNLAKSHQNRGWEQFTNQTISTLSRSKDTLVFMLWGDYAQKKIDLIDQNKHLVLCAPHPSPLSAHRGFFGQNHFSKANQFLLSNGVEPISWQVAIG